MEKKKKNKKFTLSAFSIILMIITFFYNKFSFAIIKIEEAESNIDVLFEKKIDLLQIIYCKNIFFQVYLYAIKFLIIFFPACGSKESCCGRKTNFNKGE